MSKRKILFLDGNCEGRAIVDNGDGILNKERIYCLNSITEEWSLSKTSNVAVEIPRFYSYFD